MADSSLSLKTMAPVASIEDQRGSDSDLDARLFELEMTYILRRPDVIRSLVKYGVDFIEAEDITQEVFLRTLDKPARGNPPENLFRWIVTCARNLAVDRYRHRRKEIAVPAAMWKQWEREMPDPKTNTEATVVEEDFYRHITEAICGLSEQEQQCLALRSQGVTFREIASVLNVSLRQSAYITDLAVNKLQRRLQTGSR